jgi:lysozyme
MRQVSQEGVALIKRFEGLETEAYQDVAGIWTIGYGHTGPEVGPGMTISEAEAEDLLLKDLDRFERGVAEGVKVPISQTQFDALVSLAYNIGVSAFQRSTALKRLNKGDVEGSAEAITWWNKATVNGKKKPILGLTRRRAAESALFLEDAVGEEARGGGVVVEENSPRRRNPMNSRTVGGATTAGTAGAVAAGSAAMGGRDEEGSDIAASGGSEGDATAGSASEGGPVVVDGDVDVDRPDDGSAEAAVADAGSGTDDAPFACIDRETGEYVLPAEVAADGPDDLPEPLQGPIDGTPAEIALEGVSPPFCDETETSAVVLAEQEVAKPGKTDVHEAVGIGSGALAVIAALYVIGARIDDWLHFRR